MLENFIERLQNLGALLSAGFKKSLDLIAI